MADLYLDCDCGIVASILSLWLPRWQSSPHMKLHMTCETQMMCVFMQLIQVDAAVYRFKAMPNLVKSNKVLIVLSSGLKLWTPGDGYV